MEVRDSVIRCYSCCPGSTSCCEWWECPFPWSWCASATGSFLYGLWLVAAVGSFAGGLFVAGLYFLGNEDARGADATLLITGGSFIGVLWFVSLRKLLRRHRVDYGGVSSIPMRAAYVALYALWALWALIALGIFFEGMFEFSEFGKTDSAAPLWTCAALMALAWVLALKAFTISTADR